MEPTDKKELTGVVCLLTRLSKEAVAGMDETEKDVAESTLKRHSKLTETTLLASLKAW